MRLSMKIILACILIAIFHSDRTYATFISSQRSVSKSFFSRSPSTSTSAVNSAIEIDPNDPYARLLENYAKKGSVVKIPDAETSTKITDALSDTVKTISDTNKIDIPLPDAASTTDAATATITDQASALSDAIAQTASDALAAAEKAAVAASDVASKVDVFQSTTATGAGGAAVKTYAAKVEMANKAKAASILSSGKVPTLWDTILYPKESAQANAQIAAQNGYDNVDKLAEMREKLSLLKSNLLNVDTSLSTTIPDVKTIENNEAIRKTLKPILDNTSGAIDGATAASLKLDLDAIRSSLQDHGSWYITLLAIFFAAAQKNAGREEARDEFSSELLDSRQRVQEAAESAKIAAEKAVLARGFAQELQSLQTSEKVNKDAVMLKGQEMIEDGMLRQLTLEKDLMQKEIDNLRQLTSQLQNQITSLTTTNSFDNVKSTSTSASNSAVKQVVQRDPNEDAKILGLLKEIDEENAKMKTTTTVKTAKKAKSKKKSAAKKKKTSTTTATSTKKKSSSSKKKTTSASKKAVETAMKAEMEAEAAKAVAEAEAAKKAKDEEEAAKVIAEEAAMKAKAEEEAAKAAEATKATKKKVTNKKTPAKKKKKNTASAKKNAPTVKSVVEESSSLDNPWKSLKESTLKRKTIAQLTAYLEEREIIVNGMSKAELVETVQKF